MDIPITRPSHGVAQTHPAATIGGLLGTFVIVAVECQQHWPGTASLIYLAIGGALLFLWCTYLARWPGALRHAHVAISAAIVALLVASVLVRLFDDRNAADHLAGTLLFWAPLAAAWWAYVHADQPGRLAGLLATFLAVVLAQTVDSGRNIPEQVILSVLVAALTRHASRVGRLGGSTISLRDAASGLASPECLEAELAHATAIANRYQTPLALIGYRIRSPEQNTGYDEELRRCADAISNCLRNADTASRWDNCTLVVLLPNTTEEDARTVMAKIDDALRRVALQESGPPLLLGMACVEHQAGDDPMGALATLEAKLTVAAR